MEHLAYQHQSGIPLLGILYLHRINDPKLTQSSKNTLGIFKNMVGHEAMTNVILATTMWNTIHANELGRAENREQELIDEYWKPMLDEGSYVARFDESQDSALALIIRLLGKSSVVMDIQKQILTKIGLI